MINLISKVQTFPDADIIDRDAKYQSGDKYYANGPRLHEFLQEINQKVLSHYDTITVGEMPYVEDEDEILKVVGEERHELNMIFIFELVNISNIPGAPRMTLYPWKPAKLRRIVSKWQNVMRERGGWNSVFLENHDNPRTVSHLTDDSDGYRELGAKLLSLMATTLSGTLYVYQGEELGMCNVPLSWGPEEYKDVESQNYWKKMNDLYPGDQKMLDYAKEVMQKKARDHARTPVQWSDEENAGFCDRGVKPWMRVNDNYVKVNAKAQASFNSPDQLSVLQYWKRGLEHRKKHKDVFVYGRFELLADDDDDSIFAYKRASDNEAFVVVLNISGNDVDFAIPADAGVEKWMAGNYSSNAPEKSSTGSIQLRPWEGILAVAKP